MAQWWECSPPTNVDRVQILASTPYVDWVCCWFSPLLREVFLRVLRFSPLLKTPTFPNSNSTRSQVNEEPLCRCATSKSLFVYLFIYLFPVHWKMSWTWTCDQLKTSNLSAKGEYLSLGQRMIAKNTLPRWIGTWARDMVMWYWTADALLWQLSIDHNLDVQYQVAPGYQEGPTLARKCDSSHWYSSGGNGRGTGVDVRSREYQNFSDR